MCAICKAVIVGTGSKLTAKGCETIKNASGGNIVPNPNDEVIILNFLCYENIRFYCKYISS